MTEGGVTVIVASLSLAVSFGSFFVSLSAQAKANRAAKESARLANGTLETEVRTTISTASAHVSTIAVEITPLLAKKKAAKLSIVEQAQFDALIKIHHASIEILLNAYDEACSKYLDNKIDRESFKRKFRTEIKNLVESNAVKGFLDPHTTSYMPILKVYNKWFP